MFGEVRVCAGTDRHMYVKQEALGMSGFAHLMEAARHWQTLSGHTGKLVSLGGQVCGHSVYQHTLAKV